MIKITEDAVEIRGNIPEILYDILCLFKALNKNCSKIEKIMISQVLDDVVEMIDVENE